MYPNQLFSNHDTVGMKHHRSNHNDCSPRHNNRILRLIILKLRPIKIKVLVNESDEIGCIGRENNTDDAEGEEDELNFVDGYSIEEVVVDVDEDGGDAVESDGYGEGKVEL